MPPHGGRRAPKYLRTQSWPIVIRRHDLGDPQERTNVSSATEGKQEEAAAHAEGKEGDQTAQEARDRRRALHQALRYGRGCAERELARPTPRKRHAPLFTSPPDPSRAVRASRASLFPDGYAQDDRGRPPPGR